MPDQAPPVSNSIDQSLNNSLTANDNLNSSLNNSLKSHQNTFGSSAPTSSGKKFDPDAAMNAALNEQVGSIFDLADLSLSLSQLSATMETTAVANGTSNTALWSDLLNEQGLFSSSGGFNLLKLWSQSSYPRTADGFKAFLMAQDPSGGLYNTYFASVYNDPNLTAADKDSFTQTIAVWYGESNGDLQEFQGKTSVVAQQLNQSSTNLQDWQNIDSALKPTQEQDAAQQLIAELSSETDLFSDIVVK